MTLYISKEFNLYEFEAWGEGLAVYKKLEEYDVIEEAEEYIADHLSHGDIITEKNINDFLRFEMEYFIDDVEAEQAEELIQYFMEKGIEHGYLHGVKSWLDTMELVTDNNDDDYVIRYTIKDDDIYIEGGKLYIINRPLKQVSIFKAVGNQVIYDGYEEL